MTAEQAMAEIWGTLCPDCAPTDYEHIIREITYWRHHPDGYCALCQVQAGVTDADEPPEAVK